MPHCRSDRYGPHFRHGVFVSRASFSLCCSASIGASPRFDTLVVRDYSTRSSGQSGTLCPPLPFSNPADPKIAGGPTATRKQYERSEEHTSELQSLRHLV